jgi:hypothetical protein
MFLRGQRRLLRGDHHQPHLHVPEILGESFEARAASMVPALSYREALEMVIIQR